VYSHRALALHSLVGALPNNMAISANDTILPVVPMFHANAWGLPYIAAFAGAGMVLPGPKLDAESVLDLLADEQVTVTAGVPTVWMAILQALEKEPDRWDLSHLRQMIVGGSAVPRSMLEGFDRHGLTILHAWGMTESSPLGTVCRLVPELRDSPEDQKYEFRARQGMPAPYVEIRARGEDGELIPWDDQAMGELEIRGPWVASAYWRGRGEEKFTDDGWFQTGDVVTINEQGCIRIADRSKDLVKSGGEWISSVDMENNLMAHPAVAEAAVIAIADEKWGERPLAVIVLRDGSEASPDELREHLTEHFAKWQLPERFEFMAEIPRTATGKFKKTELREMFVEAPVSN
jgi:fatty-acyl-CoA synthase